MSSRQIFTAVYLMTEVDIEPWFWHSHGPDRGWRGGRQPGQIKNG